MVGFGYEEKGVGWEGDGGDGEVFGTSLTSDRAGEETVMFSRGLRGCWLCPI